MTTAATRHDDRHGLAQLSQRSHHTSAQGHAGSHSITKGHQTIINALAGGLSGVSVSVVFAPLDVVRTRMMVQRKPINADASQFLGIFGMVRHMYRTEGLRSLYKGLGTTMIGYIPNWSIYFTAYEYAKDYFGQFESLGGHSGVLSNLFSSVTAGAITSVATSPVWVVKTRMQTQVGNMGYSSTMNAFKTIYQTEGLIAFYRGLMASMIGLVHLGIQFPLYEYLKVVMRERRNGQSGQKYWDVVVASAVSKAIASVVAYPHEVLRSRMQDHVHGVGIQAKGYNFKPYSNLRNATRTILQEEGVQGLYRGLGSNLLRTVPAAVVTLFSYEVIVKWLSAAHSAANRIPLSTAPSVSLATSSPVKDVE